MIQFDRSLPTLLPIYYIMIDFIADESRSERFLASSEFRIFHRLIFHVKAPVKFIIMVLIQCFLYFFLFSDTELKLPGGVN